MIEHKCISEVCDTIPEFDVSYLSVDDDGIIDL